MSSNIIKANEIFEVNGEFLRYNSTEGGGQLEWYVKPDDEFVAANGGIEFFEKYDSVKIFDNEKFVFVDALHCGFAMEGQTKEYAYNFYASVIEETRAEI